MGRRGEKTWTRRDELKLVAMRKRKWAWHVIGERLGRSAMACEVRFQKVKYLCRAEPGLRTHEIKSLAEIHDARLTPAARRRQIERDARAKAATARAQAEWQSGGCITSSYFGDPPPGWSALDRKRKVQHA